MNGQLAHIQWLKDNYSESLLGALLKRGVEIDIDIAFDTLLHADPTSNKVFVDWMVKSYLNEGFLWEDVEAGSLSKVYQTLGSFARWFRNLPQHARDVYQYPSLGDVYLAVQEFILADLERLEAKNDESNNSIKRKERIQALEECFVLHRSESLIVVSPQSQTASCWWGRGTQWCTASTTSSNFFNRYNSLAPLIVIILPKEQPVVKFQAWACIQENETDSFNTSHIHLADHLDRHVDEKILERYWPTIKPIFLALIENNADWISLLPKENQKIMREAAKAALKSLHNPLKYVPHDMLTEEICEKLFDNNMDNFLDIPPEFLNANMCKRAVEWRARYIENVPDDLVTYEMCKHAIIEDYSLIRFIKKKFLTSELYIKSLLYSLKDHPENLAKISVNFITKDILEKTLRANACNLRWVDPELISIDVARMAVEINGEALEWVPEKLKTWELCDLALNTNGFAIKWTPRKFQTPGLWMRAVIQSPKLLNNMPFDKIRDGMYEAAIKKDGTVLKWVHEDSQTKEMCFDAVTNNPESIKWVSSRLLTAKLCKLALASKPELLQTLPDKWKKKLTPKIELTDSDSSDQTQPIGTLQNTGGDVAQSTAKPVLWTVDLLNIQQRIQEYIPKEHDITIIPRV